MPPDLDGYRTLNQLGVGARSTINLVMRIAGGQRFALKHVVRRTGDDDRFIQQAETEYEVTHALNHPVLRKSHQIDRTRKWFRVTELRLLMEYVEGSTLEQARPTKLTTVIDIFRQVANGLAALHDAGYVHADIKPNNIMITDDRRVKIIDFGQSCKIGHKKERIQGTPDYIAPEQVQRLPLDRRTDVFNLGATMYWVLTNRPFPTDIQPDAQSGGFQIAGPKEAPKDLVRSIPEALSTLVMECCAKSPGKRPPDMNQLIARLDVAEQMSRRTTAPGGGNAASDRSATE